MELFGSKPVRKPNGSLNDRPVALHPSSVVAGQPRLAALVQKPTPEWPAALVAFQSRVKTSRVFVSEVTAHAHVHIQALPL